MGRTQRRRRCSLGSGFRQMISLSVCCIFIPFSWSTLIPVHQRIGRGNVVIVVAPISQRVLGSQLISRKPFLNFQITLRRPVMGGPIFFRGNRRDFARVAECNIDVGLLISFAKCFRWLVFTIAGHCLQGTFGTLPGRVFDHILIQVCLVSFQRSIRVWRTFIMMKQKAFLDAAGDSRTRLIIIVVCVSATWKSCQKHNHKSAEQ